MPIDRRDFLKTSSSAFAAAAASAGLTGHAAPQAGQAVQGGQTAPAPGPMPGPQKLTEKGRLNRIASCSYPIRSIFKSRAGGRGGANPATQELKKKYGEITMLDFPQWTKEHFPGVTHMDIFSGLMGDVTDDSMYTRRPDGGPGTFDPSTPSGRKWLERLAANTASTGVKVHHISNNAPANLSSDDETLRKAGVEVGKKWLD